MSDPLDRAQDCEQEHLEIALKRLKTKQIRENNPDIHCVDCGDEICVTRREINPGCLRCIYCQAEVEARYQHNKRPRLYP